MRDIALRMTVSAGVGAAILLSGCAMRYPVIKPPSKRDRVVLQSSQSFSFQSERPLLSQMDQRKLLPKVLQKRQANVTEKGFWESH